MEQSTENLPTKLSNYFLFLHQVVATAHSLLALNPNKAVRGHDKTTPYFIYPVGCAYWILEDNNGISLEDRLLLATAMLFHDVLEDTSFEEKDIRKALKTTTENLIEVPLTDTNIEQIIGLINLCTIKTDKGSLGEFELFSTTKEEIPDELWYLKLVDKYFNIFGSKQYFIDKGILNEYLAFVQFLVDKVAAGKFKDSSFLPAAQGLITKLAHSK